MGESYQSKRERRQCMLKALPVNLREHVSLLNVEAVVALSPQTQNRLLGAIQAGLTRVPHAISRRSNANEACPLTGGFPVHD